MCARPALRLRSGRRVLGGCLALIFTLALPSTTRADAPRAPVYLWLEPEWFGGVRGRFAAWSGGPYSPTGAWAIAGPGTSAEWTQGGESEWSSLGAPAEETSAHASRDVTIPRAGKYRVWVRYVDHRDRAEPFRVVVWQHGRDVVDRELGAAAIVPRGDEYELYWGFSFGWAPLDAELVEGPATVELAIDRAGEAWRQVDAILVTDDLAYVPIAREKPPFAYLAEADSGAGPPVGAGAAWRGSAAGIRVGASWHREPLGGRDFSLWTQIGTDAKWWSQQNLDALTLYDLLMHDGPPHDIRDQFAKQYAGRKDVPILSWPNLLPGFYLADLDLSTGNPVRKWLERTKTPFYILTNYARPHFDEKTGRETLAALTGPLAEQVLGFIHGEALGPPGVPFPSAPLGKTRAAHLEAFGQQLISEQLKTYGKIYSTPPAPSLFARSISCLATDLGNALAHELHRLGARVGGYEEDATNFHVPLRIAFQRGAARQFGGAWIDYASSNFADACNAFTQQPTVPRGAINWYVNKYSVTDGVSASWYRKLYYLHYLGGASAVFWEQFLTNQFLLPGPGKHPIELSPFGRATVDLMAFVDRVGDRGEPYTPIAVLLSSAHGYTHVSYDARMLELFDEDDDDRALRELFNVLWAPAARLEGEPGSPDTMSMPGAIHGDLYDVLVDRPEKARAMLDYPIVWAAGGAQLAPLRPVLAEYLRAGGTLIVDARQMQGLPREWLGVRASGETLRAEGWFPDGAAPRPATPYRVAKVTLDGARVLAWAAPGVPLLVRQGVGAGAVIVHLAPRGLGLDERAHPSLPWLLDGLTDGLTPITVARADGRRSRGELEWQLNRTARGWLVTAMEHGAVDKTPSGVARVDRRRAVEIVIRTRLAVTRATLETEPRPLEIATLPSGEHEVRLTLPAGDLAVVRLE